MNFLINARVESVSTRDVSVGTSHRRSQKKCFAGGLHTGSPTNLDLSETFELNTKLEY